MDYPKELVDLLAALLTPTIAFAALILGFQNYRLAPRRKQDELFDRRYAFYQRLRSIWVSSGTGARPNEDPNLNVEDLIPIAEEAQFHFGDDIATHILSIEGSGNSGHTAFPNEEFVRPFRRYLLLG